MHPSEVEPDEDARRRHEEHDHAVEGELVAQAPGRGLLAIVETLVLENFDDGRNESIDEALLGLAGHGRDHVLPESAQAREHQACHQRDGDDEESIDCEEREEVSVPARVLQHLGHGGVVGVAFPEDEPDQGDRDEHQGDQRPRVGDGLAEELRHGVVLERSFPHSCEHVTRARAARAVRAAIVALMAKPDIGVRNQLVLEPPARPNHLLTREG